MKQQLHVYESLGEGLLHGAASINNFTSKQEKSELCHVAINAFATLVLFVLYVIAVGTIEHRFLQIVP